MHKACQRHLFSQIQEFSVTRPPPSCWCCHRLFFFFERSNNMSNNHYLISSRTFLLYRTPHFRFEYSANLRNTFHFFAIRLAIGGITCIYFRFKMWGKRMGDKTVYRCFYLWENILKHGKHLCLRIYMNELLGLWAIILKVDLNNFI